jgi:hypothetical protein
MECEVAETARVVIAQADRTTRNQISRSGPCTQPTSNLRDEHRWIVLQFRQRKRTKSLLVVHEAEGPKAGSGLNCSEPHASRFKTMR